MKKGMTSLTALLLTLLLALGGVAFSDGNVESPSLSDEEVITCEHEFMETLEYENGRSEFIPLNDWEHVFNAYAPAWEQCAKCGLKRSVGEKLYYTETNKHAFADGVCTDCGEASACPHDMKVLLYAQDSYTPYEQIDAATHRVTYTTTPYYRCLRCGEEWHEDSLQPQTVVQTEKHQFSEGPDGGWECYACGYVSECAHENTVEVYGWAQDISDYTPVDGYTHLVTGTRFWYEECADCGKRLSDDPVREEQANVVENHNIAEMDGLYCWDCGYCPNTEEELPVYSCDHTQTYERTITGNGYMPVEGTNTHIAASYITEQTVCANNLCQKIVSENTAYTPDSSAAPDYHTFAGGVCTVCGYACPHADTYEWYEPDYDASTYTPVDAWTHTYAEHGTLKTVCENCGATVSEKEEVRTGTESHAYFDGVCDWCGVENACPHDLTTVDYIWDEPTYVKIDENTHKMAYDAEGYITCLRCGETVGTTPVRHVEMIEEHSFYEGECYCGATCEVVQCDHANRAEVWDPEDDEVVELTGTDVYNHTGVFERYFYPMCVDCGERFYDEGHWETVTGTSAHYFDFALSSPGVGCMVCGYVPGAEADKFVCEHEETMTQTVSGEEYRPVEGSNAHILTRYTVEQTVCTSNPWRCGQILAEKVISSTPVEGATEEIHTFDAGGVCTVCGYKQLTDPDDPVEPAPTTPAPVVTPAPTTPAPVVTPAPTPRPTMPVVSDVPIDQTPAPTPTPVFTQVPAVETVHGVKAEDEVPMVETLVTVVDTIAKEDASASIQIANVERVVTTEEKQALDTLPVKEQILTFLSVIGFEEQVDAALETTGEALSESAQALKAQIQERIAAMSEEEYAAFEQALLTSFPQQTVEVDGVEYTFFVIELEVRVGDTVRIERYGFRQEDEAWIFTRLEIAE
ncbi:MAG TPA: hypothetical protein IAB20_08960 [Candidatus Pullichristensenella excrementipullorum]|nr:hypothetical protein [Candidatus Pullichristensenella excrementipullorum]